MSNEHGKTLSPSPAEPRYAWLEMGPYLSIHVLALGVFWSGVTLEAAIACAVLYVARIWGVTAGYHRYFAHRTYKTSRVFQFFLAFLAQTSSQRGVLWWASHHRAHHLYSDTERDLHSPIQKGFWHAHMMWIFVPGAGETDWKRIGDLAQYPELRFLNRFWALPPALLGLACFLLWGWPGLFVTFFLGTVLVWHGTFTINSLSHVFGSRRYPTGDTSRNNWLLAIITLGEGWHNNHHHYMNSCRNGFYWWEWDPTYYVLRGLSWLGIVRDLKQPPARVLAEGSSSRPTRTVDHGPGAIPIWDAKP